MYEIRTNRRVIIVLFRFEVGLRVSAGRAACGRFLAFVDVTAVAALPFDLFVAFENLVGFDAGQQRAVAFFVLGFDGGD